VRERHPAVIDQSWRLTAVGLIQVIVIIGWRTAQRLIHLARPRHGHPLLMPRASVCGPDYGRVLAGWVAGEIERAHQARRSIDASGRLSRGLLRMGVTADAARDCKRER